MPERAGGLFAWLVSLAWGFVIFFVVPLLALDLATPGEALRESLPLLRARWGEEFAGAFGIGGIAFVAAIPVTILLTSGIHRNHTVPGSADLAVALGAVLMAVIATLCSTTAQIFAVALYRDATVGFPAAEDYVERRPRRKSWIARIGLTIVAILLTASIVGVILGPNPAKNEFKVSLPAEYARLVSPGMPVVYEGRRVGVVKSTEASSAGGVVSFEVESPYESLKGESSILLSEFEGRPCLVIVPDGQSPPLPQGEGGQV